MNLYDLVLRRDRMVDACDGVRAGVRKERAGTLRTVTIADGARLRLRDAHRATALRAYPAHPGWTCHLGAGACLDVWIESAGRREELVRVETGRVDPEATPAPTPAPGRWWSPLLGRQRATPQPAGPVPPAQPAATDIRLDWPVPVGPAFDLCFAAIGGDVDISVGPLFDARRRLLPLLKGRGVEIGPGANPAVYPDATREVTYVEKLTREQWAATYSKTDVTPELSALWERYVIDSARGLERFEAGSLDFIFSSHVLEHLVDPIGVLRCWWNRLAPGGVIAGVVPDARYTFDLRQPLTSRDELLAQHAAGGDEPTLAMYERWCRDTAIDASPESLRARGYAIHVNYFSPDGIRALLDALADFEGAPAGVFIESVPNGKDFGFAVFKP